MRDKRHFEIAGLVMAVALAGYIGAYFLTADYVDVGDNTPMYVVQYRWACFPSLSYFFLRAGSSR